MNVVFAGTPDFAAKHLAALLDSHHKVVAVVTQPDRPGKRGKKLVASPVKQLALEASLPVIQPEKRLKTSDLGGLDFDIMVVVAFGQILKTTVLELPAQGCVNVHASMLPRWRGAAPVQRALLAGDNQFGVTIIQMDAGLDTGDILAAREFDLDPIETSASLFSKLETVGPPLLIETLDAIEQGKAGRTTQDSLGIDTCYAHKIEKDEALLGWNQSAVSIDRQVRAFNPDPIAFTYLGDKRVRIHSGQTSEVSGPAGEILDVSKQGVLVGCDAGSYLVTRLQLPVGKGAVLSPPDIMNGFGDLIYPGAAFRDQPSSASVPPKCSVNE